MVYVDEESRKPGLRHGEGRNVEFLGRQLCSYSPLQFQPKSIEIYKWVAANWPQKVPSGLS